jgi:hypothetical protein
MSTACDLKLTNQSAIIVLSCALISDFRFPEFINEKKQLNVVPIVVSQLISYL